MEPRGRGDAVLARVDLRDEPAAAARRPDVAVGRDDAGDRGGELDAAHNVSGLRVDAEDTVAGREPHGSGRRDRAVQGRAFDLEPPGGLACSRVDAKQLRPERLDDPDRVVEDCDRRTNAARAPGERHGSDKTAGTKVDLPDLRCAAEVQPRGALGELDVVEGATEGDLAAERDLRHEAFRPRVEQGQGVRLQGDHVRRSDTVRLRARVSGCEHGCHGRSSSEQHDARRQYAAVPSPQSMDASSLEGGFGGGDQLATCRVPVIGLLCERPRDNFVESRGQSRLEVPYARWRLVEVREQRRQVALGLERADAGETLEEHTAEPVDVGAAIQRTALDLLGRDVVDRSDEPALGGQAADRRDVAREPEVAHVCHVAVDEDVPRLDVAMDDAGLMSGVERLRDCRRSASARRGSSAPSRLRSVRKSTPPTSSIASHRTPSSSPEAIVGTILGWCSLATSSVSRKKRSRNRASSASGAARTFSATRPPMGSSATYTVPIAPSARSDATRKPPTTVPRGTGPRM